MTESSRTGETFKRSALARTLIVEHPLYGRHDPGPGHVESPARYAAALRGIDAVSAGGRLLREEARLATVEDVAGCHDPDYIRRVREDVESGHGLLSMGDTDICAASFEAALAAAGGLLTAVDAVMAGKARNAFCPVRPPGHHATRNAGMGFCVFNNVAIAARYLQRRHDVKRVLIADWDVHHGNGTQAIFWADPSVFYFSTHQVPLYPGSGAEAERGGGNGLGFTLNCPVSAGSGRKEVVGAFRERLVPAMEDFRPEFVLVSAGFDARFHDPLGQLVLEDGDFAELTQVVMGIADCHAGGRLVSALEGGYDLAGLESAVNAHVCTLAGEIQGA